jgi:hypothetical protein
MIIILWSLRNRPLTIGLTNKSKATFEIFRCREINSGHHNLPTYEISLKSNNVEFVRYCGGHFENGDR